MTLLPTAREETRVCRDCVRVFTMPAGQVDFFLRRGLDLPRRCPLCREARRVAAGLARGELMPSGRYEPEPE